MAGCSTASTCSPATASPWLWLKCSTTTSTAWRTSSADGRCPDLVARATDDGDVIRKGDWLIISYKVTAVGHAAGDELAVYVDWMRAELGTDNVHGLLIADGASLLVERGLRERNFGYLSLSALGYRKWIRSHTRVAVSRRPRRDRHRLPVHDPTRRNGGPRRLADRRRPALRPPPQPAERVVVPTWRSGPGSPSADRRMGLPAIAPHAGLARRRLMPWSPAPRGDHYRAVARPPRGPGDESGRLINAEDPGVGRRRALTGGRLVRRTRDPDACLRSRRTAAEVVPPAQKQKPKKPKTLVLRAKPIPVSAPEIANPMRGEYEWLGAAAQPQAWPVRDVYYRDQVAWKRIEPSPGVYDFSWFDKGLARAHELNGRFGFRVMAWCPGCWLDATPAWLPRQPGTDIPDWDNEAFLSAWERLMAAIGDRYAADPALGWVDVGGYGAWGEFHNGGQGSEIAHPERRPADARRARPLPGPARHPQRDGAPLRRRRDGAEPPDRAAGRLPRRVQHVLDPADAAPALQDRWKTAPVLSEWCGTAATSTARGADQVRQFHISQVASPGGAVAEAIATDPAAMAGFVDAAKSSGYRYVLASMRVPRKLPSNGAFKMVSQWRNDGSAPTYDGWRVSLQLRKRGQVVRTTDLSSTCARSCPAPPPSAGRSPSGRWLPAATRCG